MILNDYVNLHQRAVSARPDVSGRPCNLLFMHSTPHLLLHAAAHLWALTWAHFCVCVCGRDEASLQALDTLSMHTSHKALACGVASYTE